MLMLLCYYHLCIPIHIAYYAVIIVSLVYFGVCVHYVVAAVIIVIGCFLCGLSTFLAFANHSLSAIILALMLL